jgi:hypothetical protein
MSTKRFRQHHTPSEQSDEIVLPKAIDVMLRRKQILVEQEPDRRIQIQKHIADSLRLFESRLTNDACISFDMFSDDQSLRRDELLNDKTSWIIQWLKRYGWKIRRITCKLHDENLVDELFLDC